MKKLVVGIAGVAALLLSTVPASGAMSKPTRVFCAVVLDGLQPGQEFSRVRERECASSQQDLERITAGDTLLFRGFEDADYRGRVFSWYGSAGPCDEEGYGIRDLNINSWKFWQDDLNDTLSSFQTFNRCEEVNLFENSHYNIYQRGRQSFHVGSTNWVGSYMNDRTSSIHVNANF